MAGPAEGRDPAIHVYSAATSGVDDRVKPGHDDLKLANREDAWLRQWAAMRPRFYRASAALGDAQPNTQRTRPGKKEPAPAEAGAGVVPRRGEV
jgi:hypothetical protein